MMDLRYKIYQLMTEKDKSIFSFPIRAIFSFFSFLYYVAIDMFNLLFEKDILKKEKIDCKVISIGNITWGGTGKTPIILFISDKLKEAKKIFCILSRGYGAGQGGLSDEIIFLKDRLKDIPIFAGKDRIKNAKIAASDFNIDTIILDDGFQYRWLSRDLDIVVIDASNPFGNGFLIPRGILREPLNGLNRADIIFLTKVDLAKDLYDLKLKLSELNPNATIVESIHKPYGLFELLNGRSLDLAGLTKGEIGIVSAIGNPESFKKCLLKLGAKIELDLKFLDHHIFTVNDLGLIFKNCKTLGIETIVTTEKDAVKLKKIIVENSKRLSKIYDRIDFLVLQVRIEITNNEGLFFKRLFSIYSG